MVENNVSAMKVNRRNADIIAHVSKINFSKTNIKRLWMLDAEIQAKQIETVQF